MVECVRVLKPINTFMKVTEIIAETQRMSTAVKLQRAWERQQEKSAASYKRGQEYMNQIKRDVADKDKKDKEVKESELDERGKAPRSLCVSSKPDSELGASQLASCKSQGLRAREGNKSHLVGHGGSSVRITVGGKKIKGKKYGGPLPDYGTRKGQR